MPKYSSGPETEFSSGSTSPTVVISVYGNPLEVDLPNITDVRSISLAGTIQGSASRPGLVVSSNIPG